MGVGADVMRISWPFQFSAEHFAMASAHSGYSMSFELVEMDGVFR